MLNRFEQIIQKVSALPDDMQEKMIEQWLEDIDNELNWQKTLQQPQERLSALAKQALNESAQGKTIVMGFDEI
ncbi:hypothetical protein [Thiospirillum jenense]|uniref:Uncharacterized protein n=1 Tax=Thiospirillum jenense TaxID=1653858 RepID=A0A839H814_9GAMM|nr:hypothetical protein [Thiospirillum jenense]MBB1125633.1 hypothetical protein [Thiospirillum jenense]